MFIIKKVTNANIEVSYIDLSDNKQIIIFKARTDHTKMPYLYDGKAFLRIQSTTVVMPRDHMKHIMGFYAQPPPMFPVYKNMSLTY